MRVPKIWKTRIQMSPQWWCELSSFLFGFHDEENKVRCFRCSSAWIPWSKQKAQIKPQNGDSSFECWDYLKLQVLHTRKVCDQLIQTCCIKISPPYVQLLIPVGFVCSEGVSLGQLARTMNFWFLSIIFGIYIWTAEGKEARWIWNQMFNCLPGYKTLTKVAFFSG